jgi:hypothetical protein
LLHDRQDAAVHDALADHRHEPCVRNGVEETYDTLPTSETFLLKFA